MANLLNNAAKYTPRGGNVVLRMTCADGHARIARRSSHHWTQCPSPDS